VALPHPYLAYWLFNPKKPSGIFVVKRLQPKSGTIQRARVDEVPEFGRSKSNAHPGG
jgi:hypothetical protein